MCIIFALTEYFGNLKENVLQYPERKCTKRLFV
jgi:hypothetical protein